MSNLWALLLVAGLAAPLLGVPAGVLFLTHLAWRRSRRQALRSAPGAPPASPGRTDGLIAWGFLATALVLPWGMAIATKLILQSRGEPTFPWSSFLSPTAIAVLLPVTLCLWAFPFPLLALLARSAYLARARDGRTYRGRLLVLGSTYLAGVVAGAFLFRFMFLEFDFMYIFVPVGFFLAVPMALTGLAAELILRVWLRGG